MPSHEATEQVQHVLFSGQWYEVLDILEAIYHALVEADRRKQPTWDFPDGEGEPKETPPDLDAPAFAQEVNQAFRGEGVGWELHDGLFAARSGSDIQDAHVRTAIGTLETAGLPTAANELREGLADISRRPRPDCSGAVQHCVAALEIVARDFSGDSRRLGEIAKANPLAMLPMPLDAATEKVWGYASEWGRHMKEGKVPTLDEAELVLGLCATLANFVARKKARDDP